MVARACYARARAAATDTLKLYNSFGYIGCYDVTKCLYHSFPAYVTYSLLYNMEQQSDSRGDGKCCRVDRSVIRAVFVVSIVTEEGPLISSSGSGKVNGKACNRVWVS